MARLRSADLHSKRLSTGPFTRGKRRRRSMGPSLDLITYYIVVFLGAVILIFLVGPRLEISMFLSSSYFLCIHIGFNWVLDDGSISQKNRGKNRFYHLL